MNAPQQLPQPIDLSWFGKAIEVNKNFNAKGKDPSWRRYHISQLSQKTVKDGDSELPYIRCIPTDSTEAKDVLALKPSVVARIIAGTESAEHFRLIEGEVIDVAKTEDGLPVTFAEPTPPKATKPDKAATSKKAAPKKADKPAAAEPPTEGAAETTAEPDAPATGKKADKKDKEPAKPETKADKARAIYAKMVKAGKGRSDIIKSFMGDLGMSNAMASTYYYNIKSKA